MAIIPPSIKSLSGNHLPATSSAVRVIVKPAILYCSSMRRRTNALVCVGGGAFDCNTFESSLLFDVVDPKFIFELVPVLDD